MTPRAIEWRGRVFASLRAASRAAGVAPSTVRGRLARGVDCALDVLPVAPEPLRVAFAAKPCRRCGAASVGRCWRDGRDLRGVCSGCGCSRRIRAPREWAPLSDAVPLRLEDVATSRRAA